MWYHAPLIMREVVILDVAFVGTEMSTCFIT